MRGRDEETGEYFSPSRSQQRREALEVLELAEQLVSKTSTQLAKLPVPEDLMPHIVQAQKITSHIAHKRQMAFLAKQMRRLDDETLQELQDAIDAAGETARSQTSELHTIEYWRDHILQEGDSALTELLNEYPLANRQRIRQLARNATEERLKNKPKRAFKELFRELRQLIQGVDEDDSFDDEDFD